MAITVEIRDLPPQPAVIIRFTCTRESIQEKLGDAFGSTFGYVMSHGGQPAGPPFVRWTTLTEDSMSGEGGVTLAAPLPGEGRIEAITLPGGPAAVADFYGPYDQLPGAMAEIGAWLAAHGRTPAAGHREVYWTDPVEEPDPARWRTEIIWPVQ